MIQQSGRAVHWKVRIKQRDAVGIYGLFLPQLKQNTLDGIWGIFKLSLYPVQTSFPLNCSCFQLIYRLTQELLVLQSYLPHLAQHTHQDCHPPHMLHVMLSMQDFQKNKDFQMKIRCLNPEFGRVCLYQLLPSIWLTTWKSITTTNTALFSRWWQKKTNSSEEHSEP